MELMDVAMEVAVLRLFMLLNLLVSELLSAGGNKKLFKQKLHALIEVRAK